jgi:hypothetical protein
MKLALYALLYIHSTYNYGISFISEDMIPMHSYIHYPPSTNIEAYIDAIPPKLSTTRTILAYSNACWGLQIGNAVMEGTLLPLSKFWSMNSGIIFKNGGIIGWLGKRQECMLSAPVKLKLRLLMQRQRRLWTSTISPAVSPRAATP